MKRDLKNITGFALSASLVLLSSCRTADSDNVTGNTNGGIGSSAVNINMLGTGFSEDETASRSAIGAKEQVYKTNVLITPSSFITAEVSATILPLASNNTRLVVAGDKLKSGSVYRVVAYTKDGNYFTSQQYTIGQPALPLMLNSTDAYDIVIFSYDKKDAIADIKDPIGTAIAQYNTVVSFADRDFLYQRINDFVPSANAYKLDITLQHKTTELTVELNSVNALGSPAGNKISNVQAAVEHNTKATAPLSTGILKGDPKDVVNNLNVPFNITTPALLVKSDPVIIKGPDLASGVKNGSLLINLAFNNDTKRHDVNLPNSFNVTPGKRLALRVNLGGGGTGPSGKCGAYLGPNQTLWKDFMCHNLGATTTADPFVPAVAIHGAKYQWGAQTGEAGRYIDQSNDLNASVLSGWQQTPKPDGTWSDAGKTINDPCPSGYRVPTIKQWEAVIANNNVERVGSWTGINYTTALYFRNPSNVRTLMLPAAGYRIDNTGQPFGRGVAGSYWSSSVASSYSRYVYFSSSSIIMNESIRGYGYPIRCIAE